MGIIDNPAHVEEMKSVLRAARQCMLQGDHARVVDELFVTTKSKKKRDELLTRVEECATDYVKYIDYALSLPMERWSSMCDMGHVHLIQVQENFPKDTCISFERARDGRFHMEQLAESLRVKRKKRKVTNQAALSMASETGLSPVVCDEIRRLKGRLASPVTADSSPLQRFIENVRWSSASYSNDPDESMFWACEFRFQTDPLDLEILSEQSGYLEKRLAFIGADCYHLAGVDRDDGSSDPDVYWIDHEWSLPDNPDVQIFKLSDFLAELKKS